VRVSCWKSGARQVGMETACVAIWLATNPSSETLGCCAANERGPAGVCRHGLIRAEQ